MIQMGSRQLADRAFLDETRNNRRPFITNYLRKVEARGVEPLSLKS